MNVLVTGGAGYIGSHTCKELHKNGYTPVVVDNLSTGHKGAVKWGPFILGDIHDTALLVETIERVRPCALIHFAASSNVGESTSDPLKYYANNVGGSVSLLTAAQRTGLDKLVFSSTCATYGMPETLLISEEHPQHPINPYSRSKLMIEQILADLAGIGDFKSVSLRYFNAAGADADGEIGECHQPETHLIPLAIEAAMGGEELRIFGSDFPTKDGTAIRDYTHILDLAAAHVAALKYLLEGGGSDCFNVGSGQGSSVLDVVEALRALGLPVRHSVIGRRIGDPPQLVADIAKAKAILGWEPKFAGIGPALRTAIAWRKSGNRFCIDHPA